MYAKIQKSGKGENKGSCSDYANYLDKENEYKPEHEKEYFFSHDKEKVQTFEVITAIDSNNKKLGKEEAKFFSVTLSPSEAELKHIGRDNDKLKEFTRSAMDEYAKNFNKGLEGKDLVYFAKLEYERSFKGTDQEVKQGQAKQGELKQGDNRHIHVIVSRRAKENGYKISPLANEKNSKGMLNGKEVQKGFDRQKFSHAAEKTFDLTTGYQRSLEETYQYKLEQSKLSTKEKINRVYSRDLGGMDWQKVAYINEVDRKAKGKKNMEQEKNIPTLEETKKEQNKDNNQGLNLKL